MMTTAQRDAVLVGGRSTQPRRNDVVDLQALGGPAVGPSTGAAIPIKDALAKSIQERAFLADYAGNFGLRSSRNAEFGHGPGERGTCAARLNGDLSHRQSAAPIHLSEPVWIMQKSIPDTTSGLVPLGNVEPSEVAPDGAFADTAFRCDVIDGSTKRDVLLRHPSFRDSIAETEIAEAHDNEIVPAPQAAGDGEYAKALHAEPSDLLGVDRARCWFHG